MIDNPKPMTPSPRPTGGPPAPQPQQSIHTQPGDFYCYHEWFGGPGFWQCRACGLTEMRE